MIYIDRALSDIEIGLQCSDVGSYWKNWEEEDVSMGPAGVELVGFSPQYPNALDSSQVGFHSYPGSRI